MAETMLSHRKFIDDECTTLELDRQLLRNKLVNRTADLLSQVGYPNERCISMAQEIVEGTFKGSCLNAERDINNEKTYEQICSMFNADKNIESYHFLFIYAPKGGKALCTVAYPNGEKKLEWRERTVEDDRIRHQQEIKHFISVAFPSQHYDASRSNAIKKEWQVMNIDEIQQGISDFFLNPSGGLRADGALHAVIVFFGHGTEAGFSLHPDVGVNLDSINQFVNAKSNDARSQVGSFDLPARVEIIYAQCHAHHYQHIQCERFKVFHLTSDAKPTTDSAIDTEGRWYVVELDAQAYRLNDEMDECEITRQASMSNVNVIEELVMNDDETTDQAQAVDAV